MSVRRLLRDAVPPVLREASPAEHRTPLIERWMQACEEVLDPVLALLDNLPAHLDPELAPPDLLDLLAYWLGLDFPHGLSEEGRRALLVNATRITKLRGTQPGLELVFELAFPTLGLKVRNSGAITTSTDPAAVVAASEPSFDVICPAKLDTGTRVQLRWLIEDHRPAGVHYRLIEGAAA